MLMVWGGLLVRECHPSGGGGWERVKRQAGEGVEVEMEDEKRPICICFSSFLLPRASISATGTRPRTLLTVGTRRRLFFFLISLLHTASSLSCFSIAVLIDSHSINQSTSFSPTYPPSMLPPVPTCSLPKKKTSETHKPCYRTKHQTFSV